MLDMDTFLVRLYVLADEYCSTALPPERRPGPDPALSRSEVVTLALLGQWRRFAGERDFYRWATTHLRDAFPTLPHRSQYNRLVRFHQVAITQFGLAMGRRVSTEAAIEQAIGVVREDRSRNGSRKRKPLLYEVLDGTAAPVRHAKRRGSGWLAGQADVGWSNRLGWYEGFHVLTVVTPAGAITGFGFGPASTNDRLLAETFFALRARPQGPASRLPSVGHPLPSVGHPLPSTYAYLADSGFAGQEWETRWATEYGTRILCLPQGGSKRHTAWGTALRRWFAGVRQIVETVHDKLIQTFRLDRERPHQLTGFHARLAAKVALHNVCLWLNHQFGRPLLSFADLIDWP